MSAGSIGFVVIASEAKQSKSCARELDCFRLRAPRFGELKPAEAPTERRRVVAIASRNDDLRFD